MAIYGDTLTPLPLPYWETFDHQSRLDYRRVAGHWQIQEKRLVQSDTGLADLFAVAPLTLPTNGAYQFGTHIQVLEGPNGAGLLFNMQHTNTVQESQLVRFGVSEGREYLVFGYFDPSGQFIEQGTLTPPDLSQGVELAVIVDSSHYTILINQHPQQSNIPLHYTGGKVALTTWFSSVAFDNVFLTIPEPLSVATIGAAASADQISTNTLPATAQSITQTEGTLTGTVLTATTSRAVAATTGTLLFTQTFGAETDSTQWLALSGDWRFTANALVQQQADGYDYSIRYAGVFSRFSLRTRFRHQQGDAGGGLLFNLPDAANKNGGHMVRYYEGRSLVWGYFDAQGNFVGQGDEAITPPGDQPHTLRIVAAGALYSIWLDEVVIAENVPLVSTSGHIGLTASQSVVAFESIDVTALTP